jgi:hypothetical protein
LLARDIIGTRHLGSCTCLGGRRRKYISGGIRKSDRKRSRENPTEVKRVEGFKQES